MTLENISAKIRELTHTSGGQATLEVAGWTLTLAVERHDQWSCLLTEVHGYREAVGERFLQTWADRVCERVRALGETLKVIEVDAAAAMTRSTTPIAHGAGVRYYELLLRKGDTFQLRRYEGYQDPFKCREQISFPITYESLTRLVLELASE